LMVTLRCRKLEGMLFLAEGPHHEDILRHPAFSVFLSLKWKEVVKWTYFLNVCFYISFLTFLTTYCLLSVSVDTPSHRGFANNTSVLLNFNDSRMTSGMNDEMLYETLLTLRDVVTFVLVLLCLRELFQLFVYRWRYIQSLENWLEFLLIIVTFTSCFGIVDSIEVNRHLFVIAIMLGWFELVLLLGRLPLLSVQMEMLKTVSLTFLSFMAGYIILLFAFALSFYILFKGNVQANNSVSFDSPFTSLMRTAIMFTGEFESSSLPFDTLPGTSHVIFLLFVFFVAIVLLNLLNGLAVGDTEEIRKKGQILRLLAIYRLVLNVEKVAKLLPECLRYSMIMREETFVLYPNKRHSMGFTEVRSLLNVVSKKRQVNNKQIPNGHQDILDLFTDRLWAQEKCLLLELEEIRRFLRKFDLKFEENQKILMQILCRQETEESDKIHS